MLRIWIYNSISVTGASDRESDLQLHSSGKITSIFFHNCTQTTYRLILHVHTITVPHTKHGNSRPMILWSPLALVGLARIFFLWNAPNDFPRKRFEVILPPLKCPTSCSSVIKLTQLKQMAIILFKKGWFRPIFPGFGTNLNIKNCHICAELCKPLQNDAIRWNQARVGRGRKQ